MSKHTLPREVDLSKINFRSKAVLFNDDIHKSMYTFDTRPRDYMGTARPVREVSRISSDKTSDIRIKTKHTQF